MLSFQWKLRIQDCKICFLLIQRLEWSLRPVILHLITKQVIENLKLLLSLQMNPKMHDKQSLCELKILMIAPLYLSLRPLAPIRWLKTKPILRHLRQILTLRKMACRSLIVYLVLMRVTSLLILKLVW